MVCYRRSNIFFSFTSTTPGVFDIAVLYKSRNISDMRLQLDDLLERQHNNNLELETDFMKLNVNLVSTNCITSFVAFKAAHNYRSLDYWRYI